MRSAAPDLLEITSTFLPFSITLVMSAGFTSFSTKRPPLLLNPPVIFGASEFRIGAWNAGTGIERSTDADEEFDGDWLGELAFAAVAEDGPPIHRYPGIALIQPAWNIIGVFM
jgi:hypothetical protein